MRLSQKEKKRIAEYVLDTKGNQQITYGAAAAKFGISAQTISKIVKEGRLKGWYRPSMRSGSVELGAVPLAQANLGKEQPVVGGLNTSSTSTLPIIEEPDENIEVRPLEEPEGEPELPAATMENIPAPAPEKKNEYINLDSPETATPSPSKMQVASNVAGMITQIVESALSGTKKPLSPMEKNAFNTSLSQVCFYYMPEKDEKTIALGAFIIVCIALIAARRDIIEEWLKKR